MAYVTIATICDIILIIKSCDYNPIADFCVDYGLRDNSYYM